MISIVLPTYNSIEFLERRLSSIVEQTCQNWECIVVDGYSKDGTWERLSSLASKDKRFKLYQKPARGPYNAWNEGIKLSSSEYIYIATSDDTMNLNCLQVMHENLENHRECSIAHCNLTIIDRNEATIESANWEEYLPRRYFKNLLDVKHIRVAPHDGILHCGLKTVYSSITQLLIKKEVFDKYGLFLEKVGSIADVEWGMRVSLLENILHIPLYLATWRKHENQLTTDEIQSNPLTYSKLRGFIKYSFSVAIEHGLNKKYYSRDLQNLYLFQEYDLRRKSILSRLLFILGHPKILFWHLTFDDLLHTSQIFWIRKIISKKKLHKNIKILT